MIDPLLSYVNEYHSEDVSSAFNMGIHQALRQRSRLMLGDEMFEGDALKRRSLQVCCFDVMLKINILVLAQFDPQMAQDIVSDSESCLKAETRFVECVFPIIERKVSEYSFKMVQYERTSEYVEDVFESTVFDDWDELAGIADSLNDGMDRDNEIMDEIVSSMWIRKEQISVGLTLDCVESGMRFLSQIRTGGFSKGGLSFWTGMVIRDCYTQKILLSQGYQCINSECKRYFKNTEHLIWIAEKKIPRDVENGKSLICECCGHDLDVVSQSRRFIYVQPLTLLVYSGMCGESRIGHLVQKGYLFPKHVYKIGDVLDVCGFVGEDSLMLRKRKGDCPRICMQRNVIFPVLGVFCPNVPFRLYSLFRDRIESTEHCLEVEVDMDVSESVYGLCRLRRTVKVWMDSLGDNMCPSGLLVNVSAISALTRLFGRPIHVLIYAVKDVYFLERLVGIFSGILGNTPWHVSWNWRLEVFIEYQKMYGKEPGVCVEKQIPFSWLVNRSGIVWLEKLSDTSSKLKRQIDPLMLSAQCPCAFWAFSKSSVLFENDSGHLSPFDLVVRYDNGVCVDWFTSERDILCAEGFSDLLIKVSSLSKVENVRIDWTQEARDLVQKYYLLSRRVCLNDYSSQDVSVDLGEVLGTSALSGFETPCTLMEVLVRLALLFSQMTFVLQPDTGIISVGTADVLLRLVRFL